MKALVCSLLASFTMLTSSSIAQPLSGNYTVGGTSPNFATLQAAANALKSRGVSGPVWFNIRPGIYRENGGLNSVMILDSIIAGISPINRITFQPDDTIGGNVENVILQIDLTTQSSTALVSIRTDYTTIRNLTFQDVDSAEAGADHLLAIEYAHGYNQTVEGIIIEGCRFIGNTYPAGGITYGTDYGIYADVYVSEILVRHNTFERLMRAVSVGNSVGVSDNAIVEDNQILTAHFGISGVGTPRGFGIMVQSRNVIVRRNYLNNAGSRGSVYGVYVRADTGLVERNNILNGGGLSGSGGGLNPFYYGITVDGISVWGGDATSMMVVNNMISGSISAGAQPYGQRIGIQVMTKTKIIHNTIVHPSYYSLASIGVNLISGCDSSAVFNNILIEYGSSDGHAGRLIIFNQDWGMSGLISDYNVFYYSDPLALIATRGYPNWYSSLSEYQAATSLDSHSVLKEIDFEISDQSPHVSDCQAQDPELGGMPYPGIVDDIDGDARSLTAPTRGADEGRLRSTPMFGDVFRIPLSGTPFSVAAGKFDNLMADGLAVTDYTNRQVRLYHNLPSSRSFVLTSIRPTGFKPSVVGFFDLDHDSHLDLIVGGDSAAVKVFWGDGAGGFPQDTTITTKGYVRSIDTGKVSFHNLRTIVMTETVAPEVSFLCFLLNNNGRHLQHGVVQRPLSGGGNINDTIDAELLDFVAGDLDGNGSHEVAALGLDSWVPATPFIVFVDTTLGNHPWGHHNITHSLHTGSSLGHTSSIVMGKFSGGTRNDLIATGADDDQCILLRNQGSLQFSVEPIAANSAFGLAAMDYDNDSDLDFVTVNWDLKNDGVSVRLNDGTGHFTEEFNCYQNFGSGRPYGVVASDFDLDGRTDLAIVATKIGGYDSLFVLYNFGNVTRISTDPVLTPTEFSLSQNYPNPFNPTTAIGFTLPIAGHVVLKVYNVLGQEVVTLLDEQRSAGMHTVQWNSLHKRGAQVSSGVYFYRFEVNQNNGRQHFVGVKKMLLVK